MKKIVVLDGHTLNPGDLSWDGLRALGDCTIHDRTPPDQVFPRAAGHEIVLTNKAALAAEHFDRLPELEYVGVLATGTNVIDLKAAGEHGVVVTNVPDYGTASVAQLTFALLLELALGVGAHSAGVRSGKWSASRDFSYTEFPLVELAGLTLGIVGFGRIGRQVAAIGRALGMEILIHSRTPPAPTQPGIRVADLDTLFREADAVTLHCPLTEATQGLVNAVRLASMKPSAFLINTSRGPLVDEAALATALNAGSLAGAAVDVLASEPPPATSPLLSARNCIVTPHIGWATAAARRRLLEVAVAGVRAFLDGRPQHVVVPG